MQAKKNSVAVQKSETFFLAFSFYSSSFPSSNFHLPPPLSDNVRYVI